MGQYKNGIETRAALYQSARTCFYRNGYFNTAIRDIVEGANSKLGLFSYHFESKEAIAVQVFREYVNDVTTTVRRALGSIFDTCGLLLNDMLNYWGYFRGLTVNENVSRFYVELSTTECYLEQNFRFKEYYFDRMQSPQVLPNRRWRAGVDRNIFISMTAGMEIQLCRDLCSGRIQAPVEDVLDAYFDTYYTLLLQNKRQVSDCIWQTRQISQTIDWQVKEGFVPYILRCRETS